MDNQFTEKTLQYKAFLEEIYNQCATFDKHNTPIQEKIAFVSSIKQNFKIVSDSHYNDIWSFILSNNILNDKNLCQSYKSFYFQHLSPFLLNPAVNWQIYKKPLGYPGDFIVMNYIYDYHDSTNNYLGNTSFDMLINNYTCSIPIATSNIERKNFFKDFLIDANKSNNKIASIACGPMRELFDALHYSNLENLYFTLFDFEQKVFDFLNSSLSNVKNISFKYSFIKDNILNLIKSTSLKNSFSDHNYFYCSGLFDYLSDIFCKKLLQTLFQLLPKNGQLIFCNASEEFATHRAYYEFLGDWTLIYRSKSDIDKIIKSIKGNFDYEIFRPSNNNNYWFAKIVKK